MPKQKNPFATAEGKRVEVTNKQVKQIRNMYKDIEREFQERIRVLSNRTNISSVMRVQYLKDFSKDLQKDIEILNQSLKANITSNMLEVAQAVSFDSEELIRQMGFDGVFTSTYYIPTQAVHRVISGELYKGKWTLSKAIWSDNQKKLNDINSIVAKGLANNKSTYEIAKDLEKYVNPSSARQSRTIIYNKHEIDANGKRIIKRDSKGNPITEKYYFGKVDYNAQRLARTMISHAYEESFVESTKDNPFIESYRWLASGGDRMCDICAERDGKIFAKDELPLDHPNGMCTFEVVIEKSYDRIASDLRNWVDGRGDQRLNRELDYFAETLGYDVKIMTAKNIE